MNEHDLIERLRPLAGPAGLNLDDDAALIRVPDGHELVVSTDTMVEGVHFPAGRIGGDFSERLLRTALSDLAAKGARPIGYSLNITWPRNRDPRFIDGFVTGLREAQAAFDSPLIGGDTTSGSGVLVASATVYGVVPDGKMVTRSGAHPGDRVFHTGRLGLAYLGMRLATGSQLDLPADRRLQAEEAYLRPVPQFLFRKVLRRYATACTDISDGIGRDAENIARASKICIDLCAEAISDGFEGDDYELLFTVASTDVAAMQDSAAIVGIDVTECGRVLEGSGVTVDGRDSAELLSGYSHDL